MGQPEEVTTGRTPSTDYETDGKSVDSDAMKLAGTQLRTCSSIVLY
jgi:hypothetical protein